jgi:four helix bundle protein
MRDFKELTVWQKSLALATTLYHLSFSEDGEFHDPILIMAREDGLMLASAIAEGATRASTKEFMRFLFMAIGHTARLETGLLIAEKEECPWFVPTLLEDNELIRKMLYGLLGSLRKTARAQEAKVA